MIHQADQRLNYLILHVIFFSNIVTYYIQIYIPTFTPGLQSARETLMVESAQSRRVADIVCLTPGRPHSVTEKSHSNKFLKTCLLHWLHVLLYIHTLLERSKENGHYWSWIFSNSIQLLAHMCICDKIIRQTDMQSETYLSHTEHHTSLVPGGQDTDCWPRLPSTLNRDTWDELLGAQPTFALKKIDFNLAIE